MINIIEKRRCCGCSACMQVCPGQCIKMIQDDEGFLYPSVDENKCIKCGLCINSCPVLKQKNSQKPNIYYAGFNKDADIRINSSSGGIFFLLADRIISNGGIVFGARFDEDFQVMIDWADTMDKVATFCGSKYLQARVGNSYLHCKSFLDNGRKVLFSGTPCQVAGLFHYLKKPYNNLIALDFICHGVPSPGVWQRYLDEVVGVGNRNISYLSFRDKTYGWKNYSLSIYYQKDSASFRFISPFKENPYMQAFLRNLILRPSCYMCPVKEGRSHSDITIADFWGIQTVNPSMDDDKGTSLILVNSEKGKDWLPFEQMQISVVTEDVLLYNTAYNTSAKENPNRERFFEDYNSGQNLSSLVKKYTKTKKKQLILKATQYQLIRFKKFVSEVFHN